MENTTNSAPTLLKVIAWIIIVVSAFTLLPALGAVVASGGLNIRATLD